MNAVAQGPLSDLYEKDETAWLEAMSKLAAEGRCAEFDLPNLSEFLDSMAKRDRREVKSRLKMLMVHVLKWSFPPENRSGSWTRTIREQQEELADLFESRTLRNHAESVLVDVYGRARKDASDETGLPLTAFPETCPWGIDELLTADHGS